MYKSLTQFPTGTVVRITGINGGHQARARMLAMGMTPGCPVKILSGDNARCRIKVRNSEIAICCGLASKIQAVENSSTEGPRCSCCPAPEAQVS